MFVRLLRTFEVKLFKIVVIYSFRKSFFKNRSQEF